MRTPDPQRLQAAQAIPPDRTPVDGLTLQIEIERNLRRVLDAAQQRFNVDLRRWKASFDLRGLCAGQTRMGENTFRFNLEIAARDPPAFISIVLPHEVAHAVCFALYGRRKRPHGREWKHICRSLGGTAMRCHTFDADHSRQLNRYAYECGCRGWLLTSIRVNRSRRGIQYFCRKCEEPLKPAPNPTRQASEQGIA